MTLQTTVSIAERKEPVRRWEKVPAGHLPPCHCTNPGFNADWPDGCLASLKGHVRTRCKFLALILCGMSFRDSEPWLEPTLTSRRRGGKGYPARKWSPGKNAEYPQNVIYAYGVILEKSTRVTSAKDTSTKDYGIDLNYQCVIFWVFFSIHLQKKLKTFIFNWFLS